MSAVYSIQFNAAQHSSSVAEGKESRQPATWLLDHFTVRLCGVNGPDSGKCRPGADCIDFWMVHAPMHACLRRGILGRVYGLVRVNFRRLVPMHACSMVVWIKKVLAFGILGFSFGNLRACCHRGYFSGRVGRVSDITCHMGSEPQLQCPSAVIVKPSVFCSQHGFCSDDNVHQSGHHCSRSAALMEILEVHTAAAVAPR
jgi:hypothetical protein